MDGHRRRHIGGVASSIENLREAEGLNAPLKSETAIACIGNARQDFKTCYVWILVRIEWCVVLGTAAVALARRSARVPVSTVPVLASRPDRSRFNVCRAISLVSTRAILVAGT